ncbi:MAG: DUF2478 domain-containing protein [Rhodobacteraceae bacterium]|nr:DUF2478 domain-containing protein [Paracoccaceae bacterium]
MDIGYVMAGSGDDTDALLARTARTLAARGARLAGAVQTNTTRPGSSKCDMDIRILPEGAVIRISQCLGAGARGCRLDMAALEQAVGLVASALAAGADLLILNKFGKHEAAGRGFRPVIAEAVVRGIPVLTGLNALNRPSFLTFTGGAGCRLGATEEALLAWTSRVERSAGWCQSNLGCGEAVG